MSRTSASFANRQLSVSHEVEVVLPWVDELTLQCDELNAEHRGLLEELNNLLFALRRADIDLITPALTTLSAEAEAHFAAEKELMRVVDYPDSAAHIEKHEHLLRSIEEIGFSLTSDQISWAPASALSALKQWFVPHLTYSDRHLADFIAARSAAREAS